MKHLSLTLVLAALIGGCSAPGDTPAPAATPAPPAASRLYIFDNGEITGLDPKLFGFTREELKEVDFVNVSYLVVHPRGTVMFDTGGIGDDHFTADGTPVKEGVLSASRKLVPQMEAAGVQPSDVTHLVLSHYHADHTANANLFAGATWIVQKAERDVMFAEPPAPIMQPATYGALETARTRILNNEDLDVFGDGTVVVKSTPGHTPGHQVLFVKLAKYGPVILSGDLYHYPEEIATGKTPDFEFDKALSAKSRELVQAFAKAQAAQLWIEHDKATHASLPRSPQYLD